MKWPWAVFLIFSPSFCFGFSLAKSLSTENDPAAPLDAPSIASDEQLGNETIAHGFSAQTADELPARKAYIPADLQQFILQLAGDQGLSGLLPRQAAAPAAPAAPAALPGVAPGGGIPPGAAIQPTQVPTVTIFQLSGKPVPYTQTFVPTPSPWPQPSPGTIGLGTLTGQVGVVKTTS